MQPGVRDQPTFKRESKSTEKVPEHFSEIDQDQYEKFTRHRSSPLIEFGAKKTQQDINLRRIIMQRSRIPAEYDENKLFSTMFNEYVFNKREVGKNLSNVILSYLLRNRVKNPRISFELSNCNSVHPLRIDKAVTKNEADLILHSPEIVAKHLETYRAFLKNWLDFTKLGEILQDFVARGNEFAPGFFPADKWVVRRMNLVQLNFLKEGPQKPALYYTLGHEVNFFWDIKRKPTGYVFNYGLIDSITIKNYKFHNDLNINFIEVLENYVKEYLAQYVSLDEIGINFKHIVSRFPSYNLDRPDIAPIKMQCYAKSFRHALYAAIFYNLKKLESPLETLVPFDLPLVEVVDQAPAQADLPPTAEYDQAPAEPDQAPAEPDQAPAESVPAPAEPDQAAAESVPAPAEPDQAPAEPDQAPAESVPAPAESVPAPAEFDPDLPKRQHLFQSQVTLYIYHMYRMRNWLASTPLLWPEVGQREPTKDRPVCSVSFGPEVTTATIEQLFKTKGPYFHRLDKKVARIILYNNFIHYPLSFWFHEEGEAFQLSEPEVSRNEQCTISARLDMPVMNKPSFKKPRPSFEDVDTDQHDAYQYKQFYKMRDRSGHFVSDVIMKTDDEINHRIELINKLNIPKLYREKVEYWRPAFSGFEFNMWISGTGLSEILFSYMLGNKVKNPHIKMEFSSLNTMSFLDITKRDFSNPQMRETGVNVRQKTEYVNKFFQEWLSFTGLDVLLEKYVNGGYTFNYVQFPRDVWVIRKMTYLDIGLITPDDLKPDEFVGQCHEMVVFWQVRRTSTGFALEYGFIDNVGERHYENSPNVNFKRIFERQMHYFLSLHLPFEQLSDHMSMECISIWNNTPWNEHKRPGLPGIEMTCSACAKRALLYGAMFYDMSKISEEGDKALEDLTPFGLPEVEPGDQTPQPLLRKIIEAALNFYHSIGGTSLGQGRYTPAQQMYRSNMNFYVHHMYRMMNWLATSPLIWPEPGQETPTAERPVCSISLGPYRQGIEITELFDREFGTKFHKNTSCMAYIFLYDPVRKQPRKFWFHEEGEVFREDPPAGQDTTTCSISSDMHIPDGPRLDAPVPEGMHYHESTEEAMGDPECIEDEYANNLETGADIPDNYLAEYVLYLDEMRKWIVSNDGAKIFAVRCSVIHFEMNYVHDLPLNEIQLELVDVRPCAEGHGLYKLLLYVIIQAVKHADKVGKFTILDCLPENAMILSRLGFKTDPRAPARSFSTLRSFWMTKDAMADVTFDSWKMGRLLETDVVNGVHFKESAMPTAEMLNSQVYVDTYAATKDQAAAVAAMRNSLSAGLNTCLGMPARGDKAVMPPVKRASDFKSSQSKEQIRRSTRDVDDLHYQRFAALRPEIDAMISTLQYRTATEISQRREIIDDVTVPVPDLKYDEHESWDKEFKQFFLNSNVAGKALSEILMSYMIGMKLKNCKVMNSYSAMNTIWPVYITKIMELPGMVLFPKHIIEKDQKNLKKFFREWLTFTNLGEYLKYYMDHNHTFARNVFPSNCWVLRRVTTLSVRAVFDVSRPSKTSIEGHQLVVFWQIRRKAESYTLEYGFIDNLPEKTYEFDLGYNYNFHQFFQDEMHSYLGTFHDFGELTEEFKVKFMAIENMIPGGEYESPGKDEINLLCMAIARRALMYCSLFYDLNRFSNQGSRQLERETPVDFSGAISQMTWVRRMTNFCEVMLQGTDEPSLSPAQEMFKSNLKFYVHHMFRMFNWLATSPLIWQQQGQLHPTEDNPVCKISLGPKRLIWEITDFMEKNTFFFHENDSKMAYIILYDCFRKQPRKFWFHEDGDAFQEEPPRVEEVSSCSISAWGANCSQNEPCSISAQLNMPVRNSPHFKRDKSTEGFYSKSKDEDEIQFERFATLRPEIDNMVSGLRLKTEAEVQARSEIVNNQQIPIKDNVYIERYEWNQGFQKFILNSFVEGSGLSDVLMSYMLGCKIKNPLIKNTFSSFNTFYPLYISNIRNSVTMETFSDSQVQILRNALKRFFREWLLFTSAGELLREFMVKGYSFPLSKFPRNCQVLRRVTVFDLNSVFNVANPERRCLEGHEMVLFWQIRKKSQGYAFEYGVIDNLPVEEYEFDLGHTFNFHQIFQDEMRAYLSTFHDFSELCAQLNVEFMVITNPVPGAMVMIRNKISVNFLCKAIARRALMYCSIFYDIRKIASVGEDALETLVHVDFDHDFESMSIVDRLRYFYSVVMTEPGRDSLSSSEEMFRSNVRFYVHHMFRMFNWLSTSPLIWPEPGQLSSTKDRPVCQISFGENRLNKDYMDLFAQDSNFFHNNDRNMAYIVLYDSFRREARKFWFHEDGEAFREYPPSMDDIDSCSISAPFELCVQESRLGMPVKKTVMFKPKTPEDFTQMTKDEDEIQYERFSRLRPEIDPAVSVVVTKTDAEIQARDQISASLVVPAQYRERKAPWNAHFHDSINNSTFIGAFLSDILMSYMVTSIVKNPLIKMDFYGLNNKCRFEISKFQLNPYLTPLDPQIVTAREKMIEHFFLKWLDFTGPGELLHDYVNKGGTFSVNQFPRKTLVIRKTICMSLSGLLPNTPPTNLEMIGHEILIFWQIRKTETGHITEFGIIDNLPRSHYEVENGLNIDFFTMIQHQMRAHLAKHVTMPELRAISMRVTYMYIQNNLPLTTFDRPRMPKFCFQCTTAARRALLYLSMFYDITKLVREAQLLEDLTVFGLPVNYDQSQDPLFLQLVNLAKQLWRGAPAVSYTDPQLLFRSNVNFYVHHIYRMMNWIATTPLIWPEQGQTAPTESHPMCQITFDAERRSIPDEFEHFLTGSGPHFHKKTMEKTFITLYDCYRQTPRIFWFHEDGEPFREERPCMDDKHRCSVQSEFFLGVKKINKEKSEKKSDVLAIRNPPKFKRDWTERTAGDDSDQYKRFLESRPDIANFVENIMQKNFLSVIYRMKLLDYMSIPEEYQESVNSHVCYAYTLIHAQETGTFVSDILLSYLFYHRTSNERINFQAHQFNTDRHFNLGMKNVNTNQPLPDEQVQVRRDLMSQKITEWLEFSRVRQYFENFQANAFKFSDYIFNEEILVVRRVVFNDINMISRNTEIGHENMMYWEFRKLPEGSHCDYVFQYGFIDNLHEFSYVFERNNIDIFELLKTSMESLLRTLPSLVKIMGKIQISNVNIHASHPMKEYSHKVSYTCMTSCRRTMLYASFFYDINKVGQRSPDRILEDMTDFGMPFSDCAKPSPFLQRVIGMAKDMYRSLLRQPPAETAVVEYTPQQKMFRSNVNFYIHHLFRMYNWLVNSPLIWPTFLQRTPTADRPICAVTFGEDRCNIDTAEMFKRPGSHFHVLDRDHAKLILYDNFRKQPRTFWFHEEGEAFQEEMPEEGSVTKCVIQASMN